MTTTVTMPPNRAESGLLDGTSLTNLAAAGEVEIAGRRYVTADRLATTLGVTVRTLARWDAARIGPMSLNAADSAGGSGTVPMSAS